MLRKIEYTDNHELIFLDQTALPFKKKLIKTKNYKEVADSIRQLKIRGAPLIGIAAAYGIALAVFNFRGINRRNFDIHFLRVCEEFKSTRPTARNLFYAVGRMENVFNKNIDKDIDEIKECLLREADEIFNEDIELCARIGINGSELIGSEMKILTHCNAGELATGGTGTALGIIYTAARQGKQVYVYVCETRPLLQGARLTAYELSENGIDHCLVIDSLAADLMRNGEVDCVIIGADRIASNGDVINKVGSYSHAVNCRFHDIPFYVAAPGSTIDFDMQEGTGVEIEIRNEEELRFINKERIVDSSTPVFNPAFDLIPNELVSAIVTEYKIHYPPYNFSSIRHMFSSAVHRGE